MTLVGLGVGAYEILKGQNSNPAGTPSIPPAPTQQAMAPAPPPLPPLPSQAVPAIPAPTQPVPRQAVPNSGLQERSSAGLDGPALAFRLIQTMISAAHADGRVDMDEESKILEKLQEQGMSREEKQILLQEMHNPKPMEQLVEGINDPATAQMMYSIAAFSIAVDTEAERQWLDRLAGALQISPNMQSFLEDMSNTPQGV
jgi:uncharacterized membrane protein YebE (DUF533 family)